MQIAHDSIVSFLRARSRLFVTLDRFFAVEGCGKRLGRRGDRRVFSDECSRAFHSLTFPRGFWVKRLFSTVTSGLSVIRDYCDLRTIAPFFITKLTFRNDSMSSSGLEGIAMISANNPAPIAPRVF